MRKIVMLMSVLLLLVLNIGNAKTVKSQKKSKSKSETKQKVDKKKDEQNEKFLKEMEDFRMEAVIRTTKGDINVFLYPEAAPKNVANFVFLAKNGFYDGLSFGKITFPEAIVQGGDPVGDGTGGTGYLVNDEIVKWLNFNTEGVLAMANKGPNTNSSQFFFTVIPAPKFNGKYTIIGGTKTKDDLNIIKSLKIEDKITTIDIKGYKINDFLNYFSKETKEWSSFLRNYR
nr:peptidylprolyl isomerase [uncultured Leptotrichia sp.]